VGSNWDSRREEGGSYGQGGMLVAPAAALRECMTLDLDLATFLASLASSIWRDGERECVWFQCTWYRNGTHLKLGLEPVSEHGEVGVVE
jgi:hypothetical protein